METLGEPTPVSVRVTTSTRLTHSPYLVLRDGLPWTVIVIRAGALYKEMLDLWDGELTEDELIVWLAAWGLAPHENPWDHFNPDQVSDPTDIPTPLRLPAEMQDQVLALVG